MEAEATAIAVVNDLSGGLGGVVFNPWTMMEQHSRNVKSIRRGLACSAMGIIAASASLQAFEARDIFGFSVGPVIIRPSATLYGVYNDNIFFLPDAVAEGDYLFFVGASVGVEYGKPGVGHDLRFQYDFGSRFYSRFNEQDGMNHEFTLTFNFKGDKLTSENSDYFGFLDTIIQGYEAIETGIFIPRGKVQRLNYRLTHTLRYRVSPKSSPYIRGRFYGQSFEESTASPYVSRNTWGLGGGFAYQVLEKIDLFGEIDFGQTAGNPADPRRPTPATLDRLGGSVGVSGELTPRLTGNIRLGYQYTTWSDGTTGAPSEPTVDIALTGAITQKISATLGFNRNIGVGGLTTFGTQTSAFVSNRLRLGAQAALGGVRPWFANASVYWALNSFPDRTVSSSATYFGATVSLNKQILEWLVAGVSYDYFLRSTDVGTSDYDQNQISLTLRAGI